MSFHKIFLFFTFGLLLLLPTGFSLPPEARSSFVPISDSTSPVSVTSAPSFIRRDSHSAVTRALHVSAKAFRLIDLSASSDYRVVAQFDPDTGNERSRRFGESLLW